MGHDLQSDVGITVVKLATGSCIYIPTDPVHGRYPAAVDLAYGLPLLYIALQNQPSTPSDTNTLSSESLKALENAKGRIIFYANALTNILYTHS